jgi:hypothetical protein
VRRALAAVIVLVLGGCAPAEPDREPAAPTVTGTASPTATPHTADPTPEPGTVPPDWLFTRPLPVTDTGFGEVRPTPPELRNRRFNLPDAVDQLPGTGFESRVDQAPRSVIARSTWTPDCPVRADRLDWIRLTYRGFDGNRHTGELLTVFRKLWKARFPIGEMRITEARELDLEPTGDGNNTGVFVCRPMFDGSGFSEHASGLAIDVNPFQNPYRRGEVVIPELASAYLDRQDRRPGMITGGGPVVAAFESIGWTWGGRWRSATDLHHFSRSGR